MITCEEFTRKASDYLEGTLPYGEKIGVWLHVVLCKHCRIYLDQLRDVGDLMNRLGERWHDDESDESAPSDVKRELTDEFKERFDDT